MGRLHPLSVHPTSAPSFFRGKASTHADLTETCSIDLLNADDISTCESGCRMAKFLIVSTKL